MTLKIVAAAAAVSLLAGTAAAQTAAPAQPAPVVREITKIAGEVYRFRNNFHFSIFVVTPEGVIATDPINAAAAQWLKDEIKSRFDKPVRYLVLSHDHADHSSGGEVFARDGAIVVAHERARQAILGEKRPTAAPQITFSDRMTLELGGTTLELVHVGRNHSDNSIVMRLPKERVLFAVDFIPVKAVGFRDFPDAYIPDWIESLKRVEAMDFDILAPGHGPLGSKGDVKDHREYMEDLHTQVLALARVGKSAEEVKQLVDLSKYKGWSGFEQMVPLNVEGMYRHVQATRRANP